MSFCHYNVLGRANLMVGVSDGAERGRVCEASESCNGVGTRSVRGVSPSILLQVKKYFKEYVN